MKYKILLLSLLVSFASFGQSELNGVVKFVSNPLQATDTTSVKPLFRRTSDGRLMRMTWSQLAGYISAGSGGVPTLQQVTTSGNTTNLPISITGENSLKLYGSLPINHVDLGYVGDGFFITSDNEQFSFNEKNVGRSVNGELFDYNGNIDLDIPDPANFIPITGTTIGNPVTGDIKLQGERFIYAESTDYISGVSINEDGGSAMYMTENLTGYKKQVSVDPVGVVVREDGSSAVGLTGYSDFSANNDGTDRKIYPQTGWVKDAIAAAGVGGATNLSSTPSATDYTINSSTGTGAVILAATTSNAGILIASDKVLINTITGKANLTGGNAWTGTQTGFNVTTQTAGDNTTLAASTAFVKALGDLKLNLTGGTLTGGLTTLNLMPTTTNTSDIGSASLFYNNAFVTAVRSSVYRATSSSNGFLVNSTGNTSYFKIFDATGNVVIQNGGTFTDNGYKLDVQGTARITGQLTISDGTVSTSAASVGQLNSYAAYTAKTANYTTTAADKTIKCTGTFTLTLGTTGITAGKIFTMHNAGTGTITVNVNGGATINGVTSKTYNLQYGGAEFTFDGTNYIITATF